MNGVTINQEVSQPPNSIDASKSGTDESQRQPHAQEGGSGLGQSILDSLFTPGLNNSTQKLMNQSFYGLFITLFALIILTKFNIHVVFLSFVAIALFVTINWFIRELQNMPQSVRQPQQMPGGHDQVDGQDKKEQ
ncbi:unnamed protein product [Sympodiomycopsis kandeliae]